MKHVAAIFAVSIVCTCGLSLASAGDVDQTSPPTDSYAPERLDDPPGAKGRVAATSPAAIVVRGQFTSVQVNVNAAGMNVIGDAANEPSIAVDPTSPNRIAIGWRQFDTVTSNFRQAGVAHSDDAGATWTFPGVLDPGQFRSDPVLGSDADGNFYYYSLSSATSVELFKSVDGGVTWSAPVLGFGGDKEWMTIDRTSGVGRGHIYTIWNVQFSCCGNADYTRSTDGGASFEIPRKVPNQSLKWGTLDVGPDGTLYAVGATLSASSHVFARSSSAKFAGQAMVFDSVSSISLGGTTRAGAGPNPVGLLGQVNIATSHSVGASAGDIYVLASVDPPGNDPLNIHFVRSSDGGQTWSAPVRVNDDPVTNGAWQWFGTMSVAPNGRIDAIWNDTRNSGVFFNMSELYYSSSLDGGLTWSTNVPVSPAFDSSLGWPQQNKLGDYYHMESDNAGASLAYAATFNGEQDVYFLRIGDFDCNLNGVPDATDIADMTSDDCNGNALPDECERDCNGNGSADECEVLDGLVPDCDGNFVPDACDPDFNHDMLIDACDPDRDGDGVLNAQDLCPFTPLGIPVKVNGSPISDVNNNCVVDLSDYGRLGTCLTIMAPDMPFFSPCADAMDYDGDFDIDMRDIAELFNAVGVPQ